MNQTSNQIAETVILDSNKKMQLYVVYRRYTLDSKIG